MSEEIRPTSQPKPQRVKNSTPKQEIRPFNDIQFKLKVEENI
jgi:hypothetical protein